MKIYTFEQGTQEWHNVRRGKISGSVVGALIGSGSGKKLFTNSGEALISEKVAEIVTGESNSFSGNIATKWGVDHEKDAVLRFEYETFQKVKHIGFCEIDKYTGCSPDGIVKGGIIEVKCPYKSENHIETLLSNKIPSQYIPQVQFNMWCMEVDLCYFISYDPRITFDKQIAILEVRKDVDYIVHMLDKLDKAIEIIKKKVELIEK